jgi:hypothetical protein
MKNKFFPILLSVLLIGGFVVRLYKINNPVADWHSWRQADTSAVTRNFFKFGVDIFHPRYDDFSDVSGNGLFNPNGYRFVEFPIFNLIHYSFARAFPQKSLEFWGRMTTILTSLVSAVLLYFLVKRHTKKITGILASFFFLFLPYNIYYSRVILPDPLMVTLVLACLNFFDVWIKNNRGRYFALSLVFGILSVLVKPVAVFFLLPIFYQMWQKYKLSIYKKPIFYLLLMSLSVPFLAWRLWEHRYPEGIPASLWLLNGNGIRFKGAFFRWIFGERLGYLILGSWGVYPLLAGVAAVISGFGYFLVMVLGSVLYLFTFATGNVQHDYYQIPIIPSLCVMLAIGTVQLFKPEGSFFKTQAKRGMVIVSILFMLAFSWYQIKGYYQVNHWEIVHAGQEVDKVTPKDAIVVAPYIGDTAFLYQTNRRGFPVLALPVKDLIDRFHASYFVSVNYDDDTNAIMKKYTVVEKTPEYVIVKLVEPIIK